MWWPFQWLVIYVLGGFTFVPLVIVLSIAYVYKYGSVPVGDDDPDEFRKDALQNEFEKEEEIARSKLSSSSTNHKPLSGWLTIRRHFKPHSSSGGLFMPNSPISPISPESNVDEKPTEEIDEDKDKGNGNGNEDTASLISTSTSSTTQSTTAAVPTTYSARIAQTYRSMVESRTRKEPPPKEFFFCVLKGSVLFLYEDEEQSECVAALTIDKFVVEVEGKEGKKFKGKDAEMFAKRNAIVLRRVEDAKKGLPVLAKGMTGDEQVDKAMENKPWFLFSKSNTKMEDWYIALLQASSQSPTTNEVFSLSDMQTLVDTIDTEPDPIPMRWLNAILGRIFFGLYRTEALEQFIITKIMRKLSRVARPSFLGPIVVREVNVGTSPPFFSKPMLKDLSADGTAAFEVHMQYRAKPSQPDSEIRITIATTATIPTGFKPYVVNLVLAVVLKSIEGNMIVQIKKPPSNRIWYGFTQMPKMEVEIVPIVSERKIQIGMILKAMEKQIRDVIAESIVAPNMDDMAFFDTSKLDIRGGIFSEATKLKRDVETKQEEAVMEPAREEQVITTSAEDPSSAAPIPTSIRKRPIKSMTTDVNGLDLEGHRLPEVSLTRTETEPVGSTTTTSATIKKAVALQTTKKWFAQAGTAKPPSLTAQTITQSNNTSHDDLITPRSHSTERQRTSRAPSIDSVNVNVHNTPEVSAVQVSASTPTLAEQSNGVKPLVDHARPLSQTEFQPLPIQKGIEVRPSDASARSISTASTSTNPSDTQPQGSHASLIASLRTRDKKAIQSQVNTARDSLKTWGSAWAAKRKGFRTSMDEHSERPNVMALYRPPDVDERGEDSVHVPTSPGQSKSLQERLNAAAHAAASATNTGVTPPLDITQTTTRERSSSTASKPSLLSSGSPSSIYASSFAAASPPKWNVSSSKTTTEVAKDEASSTTRGRSSMEITGLHSHSNGNLMGSNSSQNRRASGSLPPTTTTTTVSSQPAPGRSMVVPRVPKRPGEVTGIGSNVNQEMVRRISDGNANPNPNPDPMTKEKTKTGKEGDVKDSTVATRTDSPANISQTNSNRSSISLPPPSLPPRKTPISSRDPSPSPTAGSIKISGPPEIEHPGVDIPAKAKEDAAFPPEAGEPLDRAESAPSTSIQNTSTGKEEISPPKVNVSLPESQLDTSPTKEVVPPITPRRAEDALRMVVQRDEGMRAKTKVDTTDNNVDVNPDAEAVDVDGAKSHAEQVGNESAKADKVDDGDEAEGEHGRIPGHLLG